MGGDSPASISGGTPSCANAHYLRGILRRSWDWESGFVVSDCQAIAIIKAGHGYRTVEDPHALPQSKLQGANDTCNYRDAARQAIRASTDFNCGQAYRGYLEDVIADGSVAESVLDESLGRMYTLMHRLGIFDQSPTRAYASIGPADVDTPYHRALAREAAAAAITLLKNVNQTLPLKAHLSSSSSSSSAHHRHRLAIVGPLANATMGMLSNYHPNQPRQVPLAMRHSPLQALRARYGADNIVYAKGTEVECETPRYCVDSDRANISAAATAAASAEVVLLFLGMNSNGK